MALAKLVTTHAQDLGGEVRALLARGQRRITLGLGGGVDVPLLDEELYAAEVAELDRQIVVASIRVDTDGYVVERGWSNFGVYVWTRDEALWASVPHMGEVRGLRPGDKVALGSTPAEAVRFHLPESAMLPAARASARQTRAREQRLRRESAPPAATREASPADPPHRTSGARTRFQHDFEIALNHWRYAMVSFGTDRSGVIVLDDPDLGTLRAAIGRNLDRPDSGFDLFVKDAGPELWVQAPRESPQPLAAGAVVRLKGAGNRIGFWGYAVELPKPVVPTPRFGSRVTPAEEDVADVLRISRGKLGNEQMVKTAYRELMRRFHPDRHSGDPGHLSRFLEIQTCFSAWRQWRRGGDA